MSVNWKYLTPIVIAFILGVLVPIFSLPGWTVLLATVFFGVWVGTLFVTEIRSYILRLRLWHGVDLSPVALKETINREDLHDYLRALAGSQDPAAFLLVRLGSAWRAVRVTVDRKLYRIDCLADDARLRLLARKNLQDAEQLGATVMETTNEAGKPIERVIVGWPPETVATFLLKLRDRFELNEPVDEIDVWWFGFPCPSS